MLLDGEKNVTASLATFFKRLHLTTYFEPSAKRGSECKLLPIGFVLEVLLEIPAVVIQVVH